MSVSSLITKARTQLLIQQPFWGSILLYLEPKEVIDMPTAGTDGERLFYNADFIKDVHQKQGMKALHGLLVHEVLHVALDHMQRSKEREPIIWNIATDYAVNLMIDDAEMSLPEGSLIDRSFVGMTADEIYQALIQNKKVSQLAKHYAEQQNQNKIGSHDNWRKVAQNSNKAKALSKKWETRVIQAAQASETRGDLPAGARRLVKEIVDPGLNWKQILAEYLRPSRNDYTFDYPDSRFMSEVYDYMYIPSFTGTTMEDIVFAIDTSGSISKKDLKIFLSHIYSIISMYPQLRGLVTSCDAAPMDFYEITADTNVLDIPLTGGGGTDFVPVFDLIEKEKVTPSVLIYFSDGYGRFPTEKPDYPVIWVMSTKEENLRIPFGRYVYYKEG